jgi:hypothetical protein
MRQAMKGIYTMTEFFDVTLGLAMFLFFCAMFAATLVFGPAMFPLAGSLTLLCASMAGMWIGAYMVGNA